MAGFKQLLKNTTNILDSKGTKTILHNQYLLYFIFALAFGNLFYMLLGNEIYFIVIFVLVGFLTSFFSKNMIVILCIAMAITNILKFGTPINHEGFEEKEDEEEKEEEESKESMEDSEKESEKEVKKGSDKTESKDKKSKKSGLDMLDSLSEDTKKELESMSEKMKKEGIDISSLTNTSSTKKKEGLVPSKTAVYTSEEDRDYKKVYNQENKLIQTQEKLMKSMNEYKPLLDTINSITKNVSGFANIKSPTDDE